MLDTTVNGLASLSSTLLFLTIVTIALRFYARRKQNAPLQVDDWMVVAAWFFFAGITSISFYGISKRFMGYKQPNNAQYVAEIHPIMEKTYLSLDALSIMGLGLAKLSALFFYRRIFCSGHPRNAFSILTVLAIAAIAAWTITFFVMTFLVCGPNINYLWAPGHSASAKCGLIYHYFMGTTISDFLLDVFILILPIPKIWSLNMNIQRKLAISAVFLLALVGLASSTARMALTIHLVTRGRAVNDEDGFQSNTSWAYFVILEVGLTIVAVNLPSLWYYVAGITPEGVLRSVRSIISLGSGRGSQASTKGSASGRQGTGKVREDGRSLDTNSSRSNLTNPDKPVIEAYSLADLNPIPKAQPVNGIRVDRTFEHSEEHL